jgi:hypothetical protein
MRLLILGLALITVACAAKAPAPPSPVSPVTVPSLRGLEARKIAPAAEQPHFDLVFGTRHLRIGEGRWNDPQQSVGWNRMYGWGPVVWVTDGSVTRVLDLRGEFPSNFVSQVYDGAESGKIFLFLEGGVEGPTPEYVVWISDDRGEHWYRGGDLVRPPGDYPSASLDSFFLDAAGNGTAWLKLEVANLAPEKRESAPVGSDVYYRVTTVDGGRTWRADSKPSFTSIIRGEPELH